MLQTTTNGAKTYSRNKSNNVGNVNSTRKSACDLFTAEFEINDIRPATRITLTKGQTQDEISQIAGASISTRGRFISQAEKRSGTPISDRSLYLFIQGNTKASVDVAVQRIEEIIQMDMSGSFRGSKFGPPNSAPLALPAPQSTVVSNAISMANTATSTGTTSSTCVEKIFIGLDHAPDTFDLRSRLIGSGGANLNYIRTETGAMATLRGRGSLFVDPMMGIESPEPIHLYIEHLRYEGLQAAKQLARNLIETLQQELIQFQQMNPPMSNMQQYSAQTTVVQQPQIYTQHTMTQPPPLMAVPPPQTQSLIQTHQVPLQSLIQVQAAGQPTISLPPPPTLPIPIKTMAIPAGAAPPTHLSQPPPSIHLQHPPTTPTQIVVNQSVPIPIKTLVPQTNYQYHQYIHTAAGTDPAAVPQQATGPGAVTIQHIYQTTHPSIPPQHVQSIVQQQPVNAQPPTSYSDVTTTTFAQQLIRQQPAAPQPQQQFITVQGNTAYMVPPPTSHSIIYSSHAPLQMLQQPPNYSIAQPMPPPANSHQLIAMQQQQAQQRSGIPVSMSGGEVKLEDKVDECGGAKLEEFTDGQQRSMAQTMVSMTAPPPIMSVPPPTVQHHLIGNSAYPANPMQTQPVQPQQHMYGQVPVPMSHTGSQQQQQTIHMMPPVSGVPPPQMLINQQQGGWPHSMASISSQSQQGMHMTQPQMTGQPLHAVAPPMEYRPGSGGTTYQQIQHPIMTASTFNNNPMGMPVQYPTMPPPPPPQPVPFPSQQQSMDMNSSQNNMMRTGQKRKMVDGDNNANKSGHGGDMMNPSNTRLMRMNNGGGIYGNQQQDFGTVVATSSATGQNVCGRGGTTALITTISNINSNDLNQDNYAAAVQATQGHRSDDRQPQLVNPMSMSGAHGGGVDMGDPNCGHTIEHPVDEGQVAAYHHQQNQSEQQHPGGAGDLSRRLPSGLVNAKGQMQGPMSMVRCNIMGKPPPPLPHMTRVAIDGPPPPILGNSQPQLQQRYSNQW